VLFYLPIVLPVEVAFPAGLFTINFVADCTQQMNSTIANQFELEHKLCIANINKSNPKSYYIFMFVSYLYCFINIHMVIYSLLSVYLAQVHLFLF
jgi:hypothetical protein